ncbi:MAG TPA: SO2930 family diheme c-type cytochrome [Rhodanobacteraceae bacterium]|nr:SO2930 family diheme c-type cytochrome [Rhodanobacteraceae bacterium]
MNPGFCLRALALLGVMVLLAACQQTAAPVAFHATDTPDNLADWDVVSIRDGYLTLNQGVVPYGVNSKLFADYSFKLRTLWMPEGKSAKYTATGPLDFPVGTIISKTFYYRLAADGSQDRNHVALSYDDAGEFAPGKGLKLDAVHLIETRLLLHREHGWDLVTYVWNQAQTAATRSIVGDFRDLTLVDAAGNSQPLTYVVPTQTDCAICHNHVESANGNESAHRQVPIGPTAAHLNRDWNYADGRDNQLTHWSKLGYLTGVPALPAVPHDADWQDPSQPLATRARSYLDANCSYCHNAHGEANYTELWLTAEETDVRHLGHCKTPVAAGRATGGRLFDVVPGAPDGSILLHRMESHEVGVMMPELGRTVSDQKGVQLIRDWIASLDGDCTITHGQQAAP